MPDAAYAARKEFRFHKVEHYMHTGRYFLLFVLAIGLSLTSIPLVAQQKIVTRSDLSGKRQAKYDEAVNLLRLGMLEEGSLIMDKILEKEPDCIDCLVQKASSLFDYMRYAEAIPVLERIVELDPAYRPMVWVVLGESQLMTERYGEAEASFASYLRSGEKEGMWMKSARQLIRHATWAKGAKKRPVRFRRMNITDNISTPDMEYHPSLTADGNTMVFTRKYMGQEDLMVSYRKDSVWSTAVLLEGINTRGNEGAHCVSADGRTIVFTSCDKPGGIGGCDLYISEWDGEVWSAPENLGPLVNSSAWESMPSLSANGEWLYFSSNRRGGFGGNDIWITRRSVDGHWLLPFNAGDIINTTENEESPFLHYDGRSLYFMSEGHPGFGGQDLFFSQKDSYDKWTTPVNLGYPINTSAEEGGLNISIDGELAYMFTNRTNADRTQPVRSSDFDIIAFKLPEHLRPRPVTYLQLTVIDKLTRKAVQAQVEVQIMPADRRYNIGRTDDRGTYLVCLPAGNEFLLNINAGGYVMYSDRVTMIDERAADEPLEMVVELYPALAPSPKDTGAGVTFELRNIFFASGSDSLMESSKFEIDRLAKFLTDHEDLRIEIRGHTDNVGTEEDNLALSEARAAAVYRALVRRGIPASRLQFRGFGESVPVATNATEEGRKRNRRTEFIILPR